MSFALINITLSEFCTSPSTPRKGRTFARIDLESGFLSSDSFRVNRLSSYRRHAMKFAVVTHLGSDEGYAARIPGFRGLLATGRTKREALAELEGALADWIDLALKRGIGLPALRERRADALTAA